MSSKKIERRRAVLYRRQLEIDKHFHVEHKAFCGCCLLHYRGSIEEHLKFHEYRRCQTFDTDMCPYRPESVSVHGHKFGVNEDVEVK